MKPIDPYEALEAIDTGKRPAWWHYGAMLDDLFITHVAQMALASRPAREAAIAELVEAVKEELEGVRAPLPRLRAALAAMETANGST